jgi:hypothetical protein
MPMVGQGSETVHCGGVRWITAGDDWQGDANAATPPARMTISVIEPAASRQHRGENLYCGGVAEGQIASLTQGRLLP